MLVRSTLTDIKNKIVTSLITDGDLVKSLVIESSDFLDCEPSKKDKEIIDNPANLIRTQIYPYKKVIDITTEAKTYITMNFESFVKKPDGSYRDGIVTLFILTPTVCESTDYGMRYDWIADEIETIFKHSNIGDIVASERGDIEVDNDTYICHSVTLEVTDFYLTDK